LLNNCCVVEFDNCCVIGENVVEATAPKDEEFVVAVLPKIGATDGFSNDDELDGAASPNGTVFVAAN
jgi:hypothetical protein